MRDLVCYSSWPLACVAEFDRPDFESLESAAIWAAGPFVGREQAREIARDAEPACLNYYRQIYKPRTMRKSGFWRWNSSRGTARATSRAENDAAETAQGEAEIDAADNDDCDELRPDDG